MLRVSTLWLARASYIADFICLRIGFSIDDLPRWKGSLTTGMNIHRFLAIRKYSEGCFTSLTTERDTGPIATQRIAVVLGKKVASRRFLLAEAARKLTTFKQCLVASSTSSMEHDTTGGRSISKSRCWEDLLARLTTMIRELEIPAFPFLPAFLLCLPQAHSSCPLVLPMCILILLFPLPLLSMYLHSSMSFVLIKTLTLAAGAPIFISFPLSAEKNHKRLALLTLHTDPRIFLQFRFLGFILLHQEHSLFLPYPSSKYPIYMYSRALLPRFLTSILTMFFLRATRDRTVCHFTSSMTCLTRNITLGRIFASLYSFSSMIYPIRFESDNIFFVDLYGVIPCIVRLQKADELSAIWTLHYLTRVNSR